MILIFNSDLAVTRAVYLMSKRSKTATYSNAATRCPGPSGPLARPPASPGPGRGHTVGPATIKRTWSRPKFATREMDSTPTGPPGAPAPKPAPEAEIRAPGSIPAGNGMPADCPLFSPKPETAGLKETGAPGEAFLSAPHPARAEFLSETANTNAHDYSTGKPPPVAPPETGCSGLIGPLVPHPVLGATDTVDATTLAQPIWT